jgi:putative aldouronate transport system permease protein
MFGVIMAFQEYNPVLGFGGSAWVGLRQFELMFTDRGFWMAIRNTVFMSLIKYFPMFFTPIIFALMLNEIRFDWYKRAVQTVSYLPHFVSWVVVASLISFWLRTDSFGIINNVLVALHIIKKPVPFLAHTDYFFFFFTISDVWKIVGWSSIIYLSAISAVDPTLYEAAKIDGAGRFRRITAVTLPSIKSTVITLLILSIGSMMFSGSNFDQSYLLKNPLNMPVSDIMPTYVLRYGLTQGRFSYAAAAGLLQSFVSLIFVLGTNTIVRFIDREEAIF